MPIRIEIRQAGAGVILDWSGSLKLSDFHEVQTRFLTSSEKLKQVKYILVDLTFVDTLNVPYRDMELIAQGDMRLAQNATPGVLFAVAAPRDLGFGLARMWQVLAEKTKWETMVLRSRAEAEAWIRERAHEKFGLDI